MALSKEEYAEMLVVLRHQVKNAEAYLVQAEVNLNQAEIGLKRSIEALSLCESQPDAENLVDKINAIFARGSLLQQAMAEKAGQPIQ